MSSEQDKHPRDDPGTPTFGWWLSFLFMLVPSAIVLAVFVAASGE